MYWGDLSKYRSQIYGISMVWVVIFHVYEAFSGKLKFDWLSVVIAKHGNNGVDVFLFLSGLSMYYAMKKYQELDRKNIVHFYKRRLGKILKVYVLFCIPFLIWRDLIDRGDVGEFVKQILFLDKDVSSFWYLMAIMICYLIYPMLEILRRNGKKPVIGGIVAGYVASLFLAKHFLGEYYRLYEILWTRIPIFMVGTLFAEKVSDNQKVSLGEFSFYLSFLLLKPPVVFGISKISLIQEMAPVVKRLLMGWMGIGVILVMIMFIKLYEGSKIDQIISKIGTVTLEIYVFHIALRAVFLWILEKNGAEITALWQVIWFGLIYIPISLLGGYGLSLLLRRLTVKKAVR